MRELLVVVVLAACGGDKHSDSPASPGASCAAAASRLASFQPTDGAPNRRPDDVRPVIERVCVTDAWPEKVRACIAAAERQVDVDSCGLTEQQGQTVGSAIEKELGPAQEPAWVKERLDALPSRADRTDDPPP